VLDQPHDAIAAAAVRAVEPYAAETVLSRVYTAYRRLAGKSEPSALAATAADRS